MAVDVSFKSLFKCHYTYLLSMNQLSLHWLGTQKLK